MPEEVQSESAVRPLKALLVASLIVPVLLFTLFACFDYTAAFRDAQKELQRASQLAREHAIKVLEAQNQVAERANDLVRGLSEHEIRSEELPLHKDFARIIGQVPDTSSVMLLSKSGHPLLSAALFPVPERLDFTDQDYFKPARDGYKGTYIGAMRLGEVSKKPFLPLSHTATDLDGTNNGVIVVGVRPDVFQDFYAAILAPAEDETQGVILLARADGGVILRYPPTADTMQPVSLGQDFISAIRARPDGGTYYGSTAGGPRGSVRRLFNYERVPNYPLYVVAGLSRADIISGWAWDMASQLVFGVPATLMLFIITLIALRRTRQKETALAHAKAEMQRREAAEAALMQRHRLDVVGQMTGGIAHDFNNLLMVIIGNLERLTRRADDPAVVRRLASIALGGAERGAEIVQKLLTFARRRLVRPEIVDINRRLLDFKPLIDQATIGTSAELLLDAQSAVARLDQIELETAILNLATNARDAVAGNARIVVATKNVAMDAENSLGLPAGDYIRIAVSDDGPGMDADTAARAFEPFFTTKGVGKGTGLGLSQVYGFAQQSGGTARVLTSPGAGTTVEILLPRCNEVIPESVISESSVLLAAHPGRVILVVEDDPSVLELAVESLQELGYDTIAANNAQAALDCLVGSEQVDVLFSDVVMPGGMNGLQLSEEARRLRPGVKVLLTSGYATAVFEAKLPDGISLLSKPYSREQLAWQLRSMLDDTSLQMAG